MRVRSFSEAAFQILGALHDAVLLPTLLGSFGLKLLALVTFGGVPVRRTLFDLLGRSLSELSH